LHTRSDRAYKSLTQPLLLGQKESGEYKGGESIKLLSHTEEEKKRLTINSYLGRKDEGQFDTIGFAEAEFSIAKLYEHIEKYIIPPKELGVEIPDCFCCWIASEKVLAKRKKLGYTYIVGLHPNDK